MKAPFVAGALRLVGVLLDIAADLLDPPTPDVDVDETGGWAVPSQNPLTPEARAMFAHPTILPPPPLSPAAPLRGSLAARMKDAR